MSSERPHAIEQTTHRAPSIPHFNTYQHAVRPTNCNGTQVGLSDSVALRSRIMRANRSRDTRPELAIRQRLHAMGFRYRVATRPLPNLRRTADVIFPREKIAIFIDGCFWHRCPIHGTMPKSNIGFWSEKLQRNVARDRHTDGVLMAAGWTVVRVWEHEDPVLAAQDIANLVSARRKGE